MDGNKPNESTNKNIGREEKPMQNIEENNEPHNKENVIEDNSEESNGNSKKVRVNG